MNNEIEHAFHGFNDLTAKRSLALSKILTRVIRSAEQTVKFHASTPKRQSMDFSFSSFFDAALKHEDRSFMMETDSGYMSHNQESNSSTEGDPNCSRNNKLIYLSEDALLEKPEQVKLTLNEAIEQEDFEETRQFFNSPEVIHNSVESIEEHLSGFEDDYENGSGSVEIPQASVIIVRRDMLEGNSHSDYDHTPSEVIPAKSTKSDSSESAKDSDNAECYYEVEAADDQLGEANPHFSQEQEIVKDRVNVGVAVKGSSATPDKKLESRVNPNFSPDLFDDDEEPMDLQDSFKEIAQEQYISKKDHLILKRVQNGLNGVLPPPSILNLRISVTEMLEKLEMNKEFFWTKSSDVEEPQSLLVDGTFEKCVRVNWPEVLKSRFHGLHYNRSKLSEEFEHLCDKYGQRFVGAETESSCTVFESSCGSPKRKGIKRWAAKSPGRRLSHLARRRITFSSSNLPSSNSVVGSRARQILVDAKKLNILNRKKSPRKTPKKTPGKSPRTKTRTPSSSAKKKLAMRFRKLTGEFEKTVPGCSTSASTSESFSSKRALFQSPDKNCSLSGSSLEEIKRPMLGRALFSSPKKSPLKKSPYKFGMDKKRKRSESDDSQPAKMYRSISEVLKPIDSTSRMVRSKSEVLTKTQPGDLSAVHKKKLQWAIYEALKSQNVTPAHPQFKLFASILARVTRRFLPNLSGGAPRPEGGTSERMLRIARQHVGAVIKGKSVDEIISEFLKQRSKNQKPQGYVPLEEAALLKDISTNKENVLQDRLNTLSSLESRKVEVKKPGSENKIDRIRKVINFGDDNS